MSDFSVLGGAATHLSGSGQDYLLTVETTNVDRVDVSLAENRTHHVASAENYASAIYSKIVMDGNMADPADLLSWYHFDETTDAVANDGSMDGIANIRTLAGSGPLAVTPSIGAASDASANWTRAGFLGIYHRQGLKTASKDFDLDGISKFGEFAFGANPRLLDFITVKSSR